jgi:hypothetical protein
MINNGVCIKGEWAGEDTVHDYYGVLEEVVELEYEGHNKVVLFKCHWFNITDGVRGEPPVLNHYVYCRRTRHTEYGCWVLNPHLR